MDYHEQQLQPYQPEPVSPTPTSAKVLAIISFTCGIASVCTVISGFLFSIAGLILSSLSCGRSHGQYLPKARTGKLLSIIGIVVSAVSQFALVAYACYWAMYYIALY